MLEVHSQSGIKFYRQERPPLTVASAKEPDIRKPVQLSIAILRSGLPTSVFALVLLFALTLITPQSTHAQTFSVLHSFTGGADGAVPFGGLTLDAAGNLYGTASAGGYTGNNCTTTGCGTVFKLVRHSRSWTFATLYAFQGNGDGGAPYAGVTIAPNGSLYGTTLGVEYSCGTVFNLTPPAHAVGNVLGHWTETQLYQFGADGCNPAYGKLVLDSVGNIYGTTYQGGAPCDDSACGTVFKLSASGLTSYDFPGREAGGNPLSGVVLDSFGNLYGTTSDNNYAPVAYQLTPAGSGWTERILYTFPFFQNPLGGVVFDPSGDLLGTTLSFNLQNFGNAWLVSTTNSTSVQEPTLSWNQLHKVRLRKAKQSRKLAYTALLLEREGRVRNVGDSDQSGDPAGYGCDEKNGRSVLGWSSGLASARLSFRIPGTSRPI